MSIDIEKLLKAAVSGGASDIILKVNAVPKFRKGVSLIPLADGLVVDQSLMHHWLNQLVPKSMHGHLNDLNDLDFAYQTDLGYRFRVNVFRQQQNFAVVMRVIHNHIRTLEELQLPPVLAKLAAEPRGLILVTGATGSGKTTTLAAMIERINQNRPAHVITIEDPIEYTYTEKKATINQREVGIDINSFPAALRSALRQNPDVILVGELRDRETIETALMAAETGHVVYSTLHTKDASESITRIMSYFEAFKHTQIKLSLAQSLKAVISQRLIPRKDGKGMVPALEVMVTNERIRDLIQNGEISAILQSIRHNNDGKGMQSFDQSLLGLYTRGVISKEVAMESASNPQDFLLQIKGVG